MQVAHPYTGNGRLPLPVGESAFDIARAQRAVTELLAALGVPADSEVARNTPRRAAAALIELLTSEPFELTTFPNAENHDGLVVVRDVVFRSLCAHHLLPFVGTAHIGYVPAEHRVAGLSKLARTVAVQAARLQVQEELTQQIATQLEAHLQARGVAVLVVAEHLCMSLRGARSPKASTVTLAVRGVLRDDPALRAEFRDLLSTQSGGWSP
ncbi:GTP cyclohydrolase I [Actinomadura sp. SCN-SB]|uniref:GTP cyclohydrolase I n=1 Tax=Actinomadura sp. SCN-SB TaxID=3373092 RepID=UPI0037532A7E